MAQGNNNIRTILNELKHFGALWGPASARATGNPGRTTVVSPAPVIGYRPSPSPKFPTRRRTEVHAARHARPSSTLLHQSRADPAGHRLRARLYDRPERHAGRGKEQRVGPGVRDRVPRLHAEPGVAPLRGPAR